MVYIKKEVFDDAIDCDICKLWIHRACGKLKKKRIEYLSNPLFHCYCPLCKEVFPFHTVSDDEFQWLMNSFDITEGIFYFYDKCNGITLECFDYREHKSGEWGKYIDPDTNFYDDVDNDCKYYTEDKFNAEFKNMNDVSTQGV